MNIKIMVTGASKGIGLETCRLFAEAGFKVYALGRDFTDFPLSGRDVHPLEFDLEEIDRIPDLVQETGTLDVLVNNAGVMLTLPWDQYPEPEKRKISKVNLEAPVALMQSYGKLMAARGEGRIINVASIAGQIGHPDIWYGMTKAALINATKSFAKLLGPQGVLVNAVAPGPVDTDMLAVIPEERVSALKKAAIAGRISEPQEIAEAIYWLATRAPVQTNGFCIDVNGGAYLR